VNSGGTPLSYSDLLLSIASAQWDDLDAREEIHNAVDELNAIGRGISADRFADFADNFNYIGNLQLLEGLDNTSKNDKDFKEWFEANLTTAEAQTAYKQKHLLPIDAALDFEKSPEFIAARETLIVERLKKELQG
jgi:hypothetical protein